MFIIKNAKIQNYDCLQVHAVEVFNKKLFQSVEVGVCMEWIIYVRLVYYRCLKFCLRFV